MKQTKHITTTRTHTTTTEHKQNNRPHKRKGAEKVKRKNIMNKKRYLIDNGFNPGLPLIGNYIWYLIY